VSPGRVQWCASVRRWDIAQDKLQDPAKLRRVIVDLIDAENWSAMGADVKGDAYEGLLERNAQDIKSGTGRYVTPRALIQSMVDCIAPKLGDHSFAGATA
jgi:type I restriction enzyme M protein